MVQLDLSKNQLEFLPEYFGELKSLRHLDLYNNQLTYVPVSFCNLKNLKWLDLKNNPLKESLAKAAGPCITSSDCNNCAKKVVQLMQSLQDRQDKERQQQLIHEQKLAEKRRLAEEAERDKIRAQKKAAKEKRKLEAKLEREAKARQEAAEMAVTQQKSKIQSPLKVNLKSKDGQGSQRSSCLWSLWLFLAALFFVCLGLTYSLLWIYTGGHMDEKSIEKAIPLIKKDAYVKIHEVQAILEPYIGKIQDKCAWLWKDFKARNDIVAHKINTHLGPYFCSLKKSLSLYWTWAQVEAEKAWIWIKPHCQQIGNILGSYLVMAWHWLEANVPVYADFCYHKCLEFSRFVQTSLSNLMK